MGTKSLYDVVKKILVPKYPWIKDYVWTYNYKYERRLYYSLDITVDREFYTKNYDKLGTDLYKKIYNDSKMIFNMLGPDNNQIFDDVVILPE